MFQALKNRNIALLFGAHVISVGGDMILFVALPFWVFQLTGSAMATGIMFIALTIPQLIFSPIAGVFVDRWDRKRVMILSDLLRAAIVLGYFVVNTAEQVWIIYLLAFMESSVSQFFRPASLALIPNLVDGEEELARANAAMGASFALAQLGGPAIGGVLVTMFGPHAAALFDAVSYLVSAALVWGIVVPTRERVVQQLQDTRHAIQEISRELWQGVLAVTSSRLLRVVFGSLIFLFLSQGIINVLLIVLINQIWGGGATELSWIMMAQGIGGIIGSVIVGALAARISPRMMIVGGGSIAAVLLLVMVNQPSIYIAVGLMVIAGVSIVAFDVGLTTLIQMGSDDSNRGRVSSLMQTVMALSQLIAMGITSLFADQLGAVVLLNIAGVLFGLGGLVALGAPHINPPSSANQSVPQPAE